MKKLLLWVLNTAAVVTLFAFSVPASAQLGSLSKDLVFTPVTPCRIMDTRNAGSNSGILLAGATRTFYGLSSSSNYPSQGSSNANCGALVPGTDDTAAIVLNFTTVSPAAAGYITAYPTGTAKPLAATVNFTAGSVIGNNATLKVNQTGGNAQFDIFTTTNVHVIADIVGYYAKPVATALQCVETASTTSPLLSPGGTANIGAPACSTGYTQTATNCESNSWDVSFAIIKGGTCSAKNNGAGSAYGYASRTCCRVPGR